MPEFGMWMAYYYYFLYLEIVHKYAFLKIS